MRLPRVSVRSMIYLVLVIALDCAWAPNIWKMKSVFGFGWHVLDLPVIGTANLLAIAGYSLVTRWRGRPFLVGFVASGVLLLPIYVTLMTVLPATTTNRVDQALLVVQGKYVQWVPIDDSKLGEPGYVWRYVPLDGLLMLAGSLPPLLVATGVGLLARLAWYLLRRRRPAEVSPGGRPEDDPGKAG